jgi:hypothetical protein
VALAVGNVHRPILSERTVRQRRIPWIQLKHARLGANLVVGNATDAQLSAVRSLAHQRRAAKGRPPRR